MGTRDVAAWPPDLRDIRRGAILAAFRLDILDLFPPRVWAWSLIQEIDQ